jgi:hypothetical protein
LSRTPAVHRLLESPSIEWAKDRATEADKTKTAD